MKKKLFHTEIEQNYVNVKRDINNLIQIYHISTVINNSNISVNFSIYTRTDTEI